MGCLATGGCFTRGNGKEFNEAGSDKPIVTWCTLLSDSIVYLLKADIWRSVESGETCIAT